jgi:ABC-2 type transport system permease protein
LFFSTLTDSALGATLGALAVLVSSQVLDVLDAAGPLRAWLPTHYWLAFVDLFRDPVLWHGVQRGTLQQGGYVIVLLGAAWAVFATKDVKS